MVRVRAERFTTGGMLAEDARETDDLTGLSGDILIEELDPACAKLAPLGSCGTESLQRFGGSTTRPAGSARVRLFGSFAAECNSQSAAKA